jgi:hypothetical protein
MPPDRTFEDAIFPWIEHLLQNHDTSAAFEELAARFKRDKQYRELFDARLMQTRFQLGLPLVSRARIGDVPKEMQQAYQDGYVRAAREVGELILADRDIPRAWPYFRAIGDTGPSSRLWRRSTSLARSHRSRRKRWPRRFKLRFRRGCTRGRASS